jgi:hypothetical protein
LTQGSAEKEEDTQFLLAVQRGRKQVNYFVDAGIRQAVFHDQGTTLVQVNQ